MEGGWPTIVIMQGARHIQVGECMLVIMADLNRQIQIVGGGDDVGDKGTRDIVLHPRQCSLNPLNAKVALDLVSPITIWTSLWKQ